MLGSYDLLMNEGGKNLERYDIIALVPTKTKSRDGVTSY